MNAKCWSLTAHFCKAVIVIFRQTWDSNLLLAKEIGSLSVVFLQNRKMFNVLYPGIQCLGCHLCNPMVLPFSSAILECSEYSWILWILNIDSLGERFEDNGSLVAPEWVLPYITAPLGMVFAPFWSGIGYSFRGNYRVYESIYGFNSKWVRKKEKYANSKWIWRIFFVCTLI